jgi:hypothetical protein
MNFHRRVSVCFLVFSCALAATTAVHAATTVPAGAVITVTIDQSISSKTAQAGQGVVGTVPHDLIEHGKVVIPKGAHAKLVVSSVQASGRLSTPAKLYLRLKSIEIHGHTYTIATNSTGKTMGGKGKRDAGFIGGGAAGGALIGGLAGGGKGALIGAGAGAGAGTVGAAATGKKEVEFPAETRLSFTTRAAVTLN